LPPMQAAQLVEKYEANLEQYGQIDVPKEGEMSVKEKMETPGAKKQKDKEAKMREKEEQKRANAEAKATAAAAKQQGKEEARAAKEEAKAMAAAAKQRAMEEARTAKEAAMSVSSAETAVEAAESIVESAGEAETSQSSDADGGMEVIAEAADDSSPGEATESVAAQAKPTKKGATVNMGGKEIGVIPLAGLGTVLLGGGGYAFKLMQDKSAEDAKERERQFRLLMGMDEDDDDDDKANGLGGSAPALELMDKKDSLGLDSKADKVEAKSEPPPKKKKKGMGFFAKKSKNNRESDLTVLVSGGATAPQFALLLAKILTYGAPGRFPNVVSLSGGMPFADYDSETAKQQLVDAREAAGISLEESAEVFANVVNCMLIDIVDLASSTLQAKDEKLTVEGIGVVIDFMNHAASLYEAVAGGTIIEPVTYGGDLGKAQLEKMYSAYAASGMMNMDGDFDSRLGLLQDAFQISEKKAQGIAMKAMQKNMMKMMKSGDMEEMMKQFGGEEGLEGLAGMEGMMGDDTDPEKLKESLMMLKQMKDSGSFDPSELEAVKSHFKEMYGNSIDEVIKEGEQDGVDDADKELLKLMKDILED
jgi:hypothetical protein